MHNATCTATSVTFGRHSICPTVTGRDIGTDRQTRHYFNIQVGTERGAVEITVFNNPILTEIASPTE
jgi:hypothetical protein